jgi:Xaa-Pro aminopeptidase
MVAVTGTLPDDEVLRLARRARVLEAMEEEGVDLLVAGREATARYVSGAPRLWTAGSRPFGVGCVLVRATGAVHLLSTWDEGVPDEIPRENLYGISFNGKNFLAALRRVEGADAARVVATDGIAGGAAQLLGAAYPSAELVDGQPMLDRVRRVKAPEEVEAIRRAVDLAERGVDAAAAALAPGTTERRLTGVFMAEMAAGAVTTPSSQDIVWRTSPTEPWRRAGRDTAIAEGELVAFEGSVLRDGYVGEVGRTLVAGGADLPSTLADRSERLRERLRAACRAGNAGSALLEAHADEPPPPVPVARGLGLGFDLPLVSHALPRTADEQQLEEGMTLVLTAHVWQEGLGSVLTHDPVVITDGGPESLTAGGAR